MKKIVVLFFIFLIFPVFAGYVVYINDVPESCGIIENFYGLFTPISYTCNAGEFLPADTLGCESCPTGYNCSGGTYTFNKTKFQGAIKNENLTTQNEVNMCSVNFPHKMHAIFIINTYTCAAGYYLPAGKDWLTDNDGCTLCPQNSYCSGGTFTYDENIAQGIVACSTGLYSPAGMWEVAQCGRILHVGDEVVYLRATKKTSPALHLDIDHDDVADYFGNMTTADVPMTHGTTRKLKLRYGGITYSVYDDSVVLPSE